MGRQTILVWNRDGHVRGTSEDGFLGQTRGLLRNQTDAVFSQLYKKSGHKSDEDVP